MGFKSLAFAALLPLSALVFALPGLRLRLEGAMDADAAAGFLVETGDLDLEADAFDAISLTVSRGLVFGLSLMEFASAGVSLGFLGVAVAFGVVTLLRTGDVEEETLDEAVRLIKSDGTAGMGVVLIIASELCVLARAAEHSGRGGAVIGLLGDSMATDADGITPVPRAGGAPPKMRDCCSCIAEVTTLIRFSRT